MKSSNLVRSATAVALVSLMAGCATWNGMDTPEKGTAVGATGGALVGAAVGGPVGAVVGAGVGGYTGHYDAQPVANAIDRDRNGSAHASGSAAYTSPGDAAFNRSIQQALNDNGYNVAVDGIWGPNTESALRQFQASRNLPQTGSADSQTLAALGVSGSSATANPPADHPAAPSTATR